jgi:putative peptidoglycan lipid II flippase
MLYIRLRRRKMLTPDARLRRTLPRLALSAALMGGALWWAIRWAQPYLVGGEVQRIGGLAVLVLFGLGIYGIAVLLTGAVRLQDLRRGVSKGKPADSAKAPAQSTSVEQSIPAKAVAVESVERSDG